MIRIPHRVRIAIAFAWLSLAAGKARAADPCAKRCVAGDLACNAAVALCDMQISAYYAYMDQLDTGQPKVPLPAIYQEILRPYYPHADLAKIRIAFSDQQPPDNATTDCDVLYFNDAAYVTALRDAAPNRKWTWLLHELEHPEQCAAAGGREGYAKRWWSELETAVRASGASIDVFQSTEELAKQLQALYARVHGSMPMERAADAKAEEALAQLRACCIAADGAPARPAP